MFWNRKKQTEIKKETKREFREVKREMEKLKPYSLPTPENSFFVMDSKSKNYLKGLLEELAKQME